MSVAVSLFVGVAGADGWLYGAETWLPASSCATGAQLLDDWLNCSESSFPGALDARRAAANDESNCIEEADGVREIVPIGPMSNSIVRSKECDASCTDVPLEATPNSPVRFSALISIVLTSVDRSIFAGGWPFDWAFFVEAFGV